ncbi:MAG: acyl-CoA dehydrogenase family protein [Pseudomonadales bacterium]|jgi:alkylation response protein AidB-like acyl-CoA dehydrogenase|nr:acyl-CoA dehydrogenase family protein [Pseudomonadales bacterium]MDP6470429.1 acyl-CoA dehydrogenase family protein [Pseudomonadales bacterium]MDP6827729.1 acyl-CoA dehydrogenase family protein [Pseudomonadales bacterium]MDP6973373.1 acyl-CoA dehydrogenase family protein [Pseudomonadales bacterium]
MTIATFREEVRNWVEENFTEEIVNAAEGSDAQRQGVRLLADKGWIAPNWPVEYGGAGLGFREHIALVKELRAANVPLPHDNGGQALGMIGPTLLEFGTQEQKLRHLPGMARGEVQWCQGYSEPGSGSDLASLSTKAVRDGDHYLINGQKIWTSGADGADWIYVLVRTDPDAPKHNGISLVLVDMDQPGVTVKPIRLISGASPFCETFFDDAIATDLIGELNQGWTIGKRLLQHERSGISGMGASGAASSPTTRQRYRLAELAKEYLGEASGGRISDSVFRSDVIRHQLNQRSLQLTLNRTREENASGNTLGHVTSIFKAVGADQDKTHTALQMKIMGSRGIGWQGTGFTPHELGATRTWLGSHASSIAGGTNEVQLNIIAKRVLGLPD